jgi:hypothetical protein
VNEAKRSESALTDLLCADCGIAFTRPTEYLQQKRTDPLFKWTCAKCDTCKQIRVNQAFERLPDVMKALNT